MDETFRFPPPTAPGGDWPGWSAPPAFAGAAAGFGPDLLAADPADVRFALDPASVRLQDERADPWNTHYTASGTVEASAPGVAPQSVEVRYSVTLRNEHDSRRNERSTGHNVQRTASVDRGAARRPLERRNGSGHDDRGHERQ